MLLKNHIFKSLAKKIWLIILAALIFLAAAFYFLNKVTIRYSEAGNQIETINIGRSKLKAEIVSTPEKMGKGLSGRDELCRDCAMLFVFEKKGIYPFWMKDMRLNLDILWISGREIIKIAKNVSHKRGADEVVNPSVFADKVLEINAGMSDELGIKAGDELDFK